MAKHDLATIERALERDELFIAVTNGRNLRWWRARRNGRTQTWKTRPNDYRIPIKAGLRVYGEITHNTPDDSFVIKSTEGN